VKIYHLTCFLCFSLLFCVPILTSLLVFKIGEIAGYKNVCVRCGNFAVWGLNKIRHFGEAIVA